MENIARGRVITSIDDDYPQRERQVEEVPVGDGLSQYLTFTSIGDCDMCCEPLDEGSGKDHDVYCYPNKAKRNGRGYLCTSCCDELD